MSNFEDAAPTEPVEPVLNMKAIQGAALPGFLKPYQTLLGVILPASPTIIENFKRFLHDLCENQGIANAEVTLRDRREHRQPGEGGADNSLKRPTNTVLLGVGFSYQGLSRLTPGAAAIPGEAFRLGLAARSALLGDPTDPTAEGNPAKWVVGKPGEELDVLFIVAGDKRPAVTERAKSLKKRLEAIGFDIAYEEKGDDLPEPHAGREHFGFKDSISQPGIRGRASDAPNDFITERHIAPEVIPETWLFGRPGQDLVWPGEFILGYPATSPDPLIPGVPTPALPEWMRDGSFLVFRRLRQDVGLFYQTMESKAAELSRLPGFKELKAERLAALLVGRWRSGAPVNRVPDADNPDLGKDKQANNHFQFDSPTLPLKRADGRQDEFPMAKADPAGTVCPWSAHIRKLNTRDSGSDVGGRDSTYNRRILRVGIPFGKPLLNPLSDDDDPEKGNRGLLFMCVQASIERQFEFLMLRWVNNPARPKMPGGHDLLLGQNAAPGENRVRRCTLFGEHQEQAEIQTDAQWIIPTGGGYFFLPSLDAMRDVLAR